MRLLFISAIMLTTLSCWGQTMKQLSPKEKIIYFFENLSQEKMNLVDDFYHPQVNFIDPVGTIEGAEKIKSYYANMYKNVKSIKFDFSEFQESGKNVVAIWKMTLVTEKLNSGDPIVVDGVSVIKFDENAMAIYHRDYFDMGAFIYENIPVVGYVIRKIKTNMKVE